MPWIQLKNPLEDRMGVSLGRTKTVVEITRGTGLTSSAFATSAFG